MIILWMAFKTFALNVGLTSEFPLMDCNGTIVSGLIPELVIQIIEDLNYKIEDIRFTCYDSTASITTALIANSADISALLMSSSNYKNFNFSTPILNNGLILIAKTQYRSLYWLIFEPFSASL